MNKVTKFKFYSGCSVILHNLLERHQMLEIPFMSPGEFELLIMYMYTGDVCFKSVQELCTGLYAAHLYGFEKLLSKCSERLRDKLKEDGGNALLILQSDERFKCRSANAALFDQVDEIIRKDYGQILRSQVIQEIEKNTVKHLLQMESVSGVPEIEVFRALLRWSEAHCRKSEIEGVPKNLQEVAGDLIYQIRYNLIPIDILGSEVARSGLVRASLIGTAVQRCFNTELEVPFCTRPRERIEENVATAVGALDQVNP
jgi:hypothetical protein